LKWEQVNNVEMQGAKASMPHKYPRRNGGQNRRVAAEMPKKVGNSRVEVIKAKPSNNVWSGSQVQSGVREKIPAAMDRGRPESEVKSRLDALEKKLTQSTKAAADEREQMKRQANKDREVTVKLTAQLTMRTAQLQQEKEKVARLEKRNAQLEQENEELKHGKKKQLAQVVQEHKAPATEEKERKEQEKVAAEAREREKKAEAHRKKVADDQRREREAAVVREKAAAQAQQRENGARMLQENMDLVSSLKPTLSGYRNRNEGQSATSESEEEAKNLKKRPEREDPGQSNGEDQRDTERQNDDGGSRPMETSEPEVIVVDDTPGAKKPSGLSNKQRRIAKAAEEKAAEAEKAARNKFSMADGQEPVFLSAVEAEGQSLKVTAELGYVTPLRGGRAGTVTVNVSQAGVWREEIDLLTDEWACTLYKGNKAIVRAPVPKYVSVGGKSVATYQLEVGEGFTPFFAEEETAPRGVVMWTAEAKSYGLLFSMEPNRWTELICLNDDVPPN
jgi:hypothetical protein